MCLSVSFPLMARCHFLCPERQRKQSALFSQLSESAKNYRRSFGLYLFLLPFLLTFAVNLSLYLSIIFAFLPSASRALFSAHLCFRMISLKLRRSFLLSQSDVNRLPRFAILPLYPLTTRQSLVAGFMFWLVSTG